MKKLLLLSTICLFASSGYSMEVKPYIEGKISYNNTKAKYDESGFDEDGYYSYGEKMKDQVLGGSIEVGVKLDQFRLGLEGYYNDTAEDKLVDIVPFELKTKGLFLNGYYDFKLPDNLKKVKPYIGGGIGYNWLKGTAKLEIFEEPDYTIKDKEWGWNVGIGVGYELNQNLDLTLGYRYENLGEITDYDSKTEITNHKVSLGLRYTF